MASPMMNRLQTTAAGSRAVWRWAIAITLAAALLYESLRGVDWAHVGEAIRRARWEYLAAGALTSVISYGFRALRWRILLNAGAASPLRLNDVFHANMAGYLGNAVLPARAGEVIRSWMVSGRSSLSRTYALTTALGERLLDAIILVILGSVALLGVEAKPQWMAAVARSMAIAAGAGALFLAILPHAEPLVLRVAGWLPDRLSLRQKARTLVEQVLLGLRAFHHTDRFMGFAALTAAIWSTDGFGLVVTARALDLHLSFPAAALLLSAMGLGSALPSTPGYVGIYQFVAVSALAPFGIPRDLALAYSLVTQAQAYVVVIALGTPGLYRFLAWNRKSIATES